MYMTLSKERFQRMEHLAQLLGRPSFDTLDNCYAAIVVALSADSICDGAEPHVHSGFVDFHGVERRHLSSEGKIMLNYAWHLFNGNESGHPQFKASPYNLCLSLGTDDFIVAQAALLVRRYGPGAIQERK